MGVVGFIMGGWEILKASLYSWQRGANPLFYEEPPLLPNPLPPPAFFFKFCPNFFLILFLKKINFS